MSEESTPQEFPTFLKIRKNERGDHIQVYGSEFKGKRYTQVRVFYTDNDGVLRPSKQGIALRAEHLKQVAEALLRAAKEAQ